MTTASHTPQPGMHVTTFIPVVKDRFLEPHQARKRPATTFEDLLGDSIERAFGQGHWELDALLAYLNKAGPLGEGSQPWTPESFTAAIKNLGE